MGLHQNGLKRRLIGTHVSVVLVPPEPLVDVTGDFSGALCIKSFIVSLCSNTGAWRFNRVSKECYGRLVNSTMMNCSIIVLGNWSLRVSVFSLIIDQSLRAEVPRSEGSVSVSGKVWLFKNPQK